MNLRDYLQTAILFKWKPYEFLSTAKSLKWRYIILHFLLISGILFLPIFYIIVRTQPYELYSRIYSADFSLVVMESFPGESFTPDVIDETRPVIYVFDDVIIYVDPLLVISAPIEFFGEAWRTMPYTEIFSAMAVYNMYIPQFLLPMLMLAMLVLVILQFFFYLVFAAFLGLYRLNSTRFLYRDHVKIVVMSSLFPGVICTAFGFILPAVHIILFQMVNILLLFYFSKRYDKREREIRSISPV